MKGNVRPKIRLSWTASDKLLALAATAGLLLLLGAVPFFWHQLPDQVPRHFNVRGEADAWGAKGTILILPIVGAVLYTVTMLLVRVPHVYNYPVPITEKNAEGQYRLARRLLLLLNALILWLFAGIFFSEVSVALGRKDGLPVVLIVVPLVGSLLISVWYFIAAQRQGRTQAAR